MKRLLGLVAVILMTSTAQADLFCGLSAFKAKDLSVGFGWNYIITLGYSFDNRADEFEPYKTLVSEVEPGMEIGVTYQYVSGAQPYFEAYLCVNQTQGFVKNCGAENIFDRIILRPGQEINQQWGNYLFSAACRRIPEPKM